MHVYRNMDFRPYRPSLLGVFIQYFTTNPFETFTTFDITVSPVQNCASAHVKTHYHTLQQYHNGGKESKTLTTWSICAYNSIITTEGKCIPK